jgi:hypothetical protein
MDQVKWLLSEALSLGGSFLWNFFSSGFLYGLLGGILGILLVIFLHKRGHLRRSTRVWRVLVIAQYLFIPLIFATAFGTFAAVRSVQITVNGWVDQSANELQSYAEGYLPTVQGYAQSAAASTAVGEEWLENAILEQAGVANSGMAREFYLTVNRKVIGYILDAIGLENSPEGLAELGSEANLQKLSQLSFAGLTDYLKTGFVTAYASGIYWSLVVFFLMLALASAGEFLLYWINGKATAAVKKGVKYTKDRYRKGR